MYKLLFIKNVLITFSFPDLLKVSSSSVYIFEQDFQEWSIWKSKHFRELAETERFLCTGTTEFVGRS